MTDKRLTEIRVGILVIAAIGAIVGFVVLLGDFHFGTVHRLHADFDSTGGIRKGAAVRMVGVSIGKITDIGLIRAAGATDGTVRVRVTAEIPEKDFVLIPDGVTAAVASQSMLGEKHLELTPPAPTPGSTFKPISPDSVIQGRAPAGLENLGGDASDLLRRLSLFVEGNEESLSGAITEIRGLASRANQFMDTNRPKLDETVENLRATSEALAEGVSKDEIHRVVSRADKILKRFDEATAGMETQVPEIVADINRLSDHADTLVTDVNKLVNEISEPASTAVRDVQAITTDTRAGKGTLGKIVTDSAIFDDFAAFAADIKAHPWKLLFKR